MSRVAPKSSTPIRSKTLYEMFNTKPRTTPIQQPLGTAALIRRMSSTGRKARPELVLAAHAPRVNSTTYAPDDVVISATRMEQEIKKMRAANPTVVYEHQEHYAPAEWWESEYHRSRNAYYEKKYGANSSCNHGVFCARCQNTRCGWQPSEIALFENQVCPHCQKMPKMDPFEASVLPPSRRPTVPIKVVTLQEIAENNMTCWG
jgi:hypothetical protein